MENGEISRSEALVCSRTEFLENHIFMCERNFMCNTWKSVGKYMLRKQRWAYECILNIEKSCSLTSKRFKHCLCEIVMVMSPL